MDEEILIPIVAILMPLFLVPTVMVLRQSARNREWQHRERMRALELGVPVPGTEEWSARAAIAIGAIMPVGVFVVAWLASATTHGDDPWITAALVGGAGVLGGVRLAGRQVGVRVRGRSEAAPAGFARGDAGKPSFNPDAYDAIARHA